MPHIEKQKMNLKFKVSDGDTTMVSNNKLWKPKITQKDKNP